MRTINSVTEQMVQYCYIQNVILISHLSVKSNHPLENSSAKMHMHTNTYTQTHRERVSLPIEVAA